MAAVIEARDKFAGNSVVKLGTETKLGEDILKLKAGYMKINVTDFEEVNVFNGRTLITRKNGDSICVRLSKFIRRNENNLVTVRFENGRVYVQTSCDPITIERICKAGFAMDNKGFMKLDDIKRMPNYDPELSSDKNYSKLGYSEDYKKLCDFIVEHSDEISENAALQPEIEKLLEKNQIVRDFIESRAPRFGEIKLSLEKNIFTGRGGYQEFKDVFVTVTSIPEAPTLHLFLGGSSENAKVLSFGLIEDGKLGLMEIYKGFEGRINLEELRRDFKALVGKPQMRRWIVEDKVSNWALPAK